MTKSIIAAGLVCTLIIGCGMVSTVKGSGNIITKNFDAADFTRLNIGSAFEVEVIPGSAFSVMVTTDDNIMELARVTTSDKTLSLHLDSSVSTNSLKAKIVMPTLDALTLSGASRAKFGQFPQGDEFTLRVSGAASADGPLEVAKLDADISGASRVKLTGTAKVAHLTASGASEFKLTALGIDDANVNLSGASSAHIAALKNLDYHVSGASNLRWKGPAKIGSADCTGASSAHADSQ